MPDKNDSENLNGTPKTGMPESNLPDKAKQSHQEFMEYKGYTEAEQQLATAAYKRGWAKAQEQIEKQKAEAAEAEFAKGRDLYPKKTKSPMDNWVYKLGEGWVNVTNVNPETYTVYVGYDPATGGADQTVMGYVNVADKTVKGYVTVDPKTVEEAERLAANSKLGSVFFDPVDLKLKREMLSRAAGEDNGNGSFDRKGWLDSVAMKAQLRQVVRDSEKSDLPQDVMHDASEVDEKQKASARQLHEWATRITDSENAKKSSPKQKSQEYTQETKPIDYEVAIVTRGTNLSACLSGLLAHANHRPFPLRIIPGQPISDARTLGWLSLLAKLGCEVTIEYSPMGIGLQRYKALSGITHDVIICLDDDVVVEPVGAFDTIARVVANNVGFAIPIIRFTQNFTNKGGLDEHTEIWQTVSKHDPRVQKALKAYGKGWLRVFEIGENQETDDLGGSCFALSVEDAHYVADENLKNWKRFTGEDYYIGKKIGIGTVVSGVYAYHYGQYSMSKWELDTMSEFDKHTDLETHISTLEEINEADNI